MLIPDICVDCHVEMKYVALPKDTMGVPVYGRFCPICDGTESCKESSWSKVKEYNESTLALLRFLKGKSPKT